MMQFLKWLARAAITALAVAVPFGVFAYLTKLEFSRTSATISVCLLAALIALLAAIFSREKRTAAVRFSSLGNIKKVRPSKRYRMRNLPFVLRVLAVTCFMIAFAMPRKGYETAAVSTSGVAIQMVVDHSTSMSQQMSYRGEPRSEDVRANSGLTAGLGGRELISRLSAVKRVFKDFVLGRGKLKGRKNDVIGLTSFAAFVEENCPLTLDHDNLVNFVDTIDFAAPHEDGTAIGDAIYHAALSLISAEGTFKKAGQGQSEYSIKSKVMILLTDGENNAGEKMPAEAARFARENGIKIYTILISSGGGYQTINDVLFGRIQLPWGNPQYDQAVEEMNEVASITGGKFEQATTAESLENIYRTIDRLEKTEFKQKFVRYHERFQYPVFAGLSLLVAEIVLGATWLRRLP